MYCLLCKKPIRRDTGEDYQELPEGPVHTACELAEQTAAADDFLQDLHQSDPKEKN